MHRDELREQIAVEAARLMLRGKESDFAAARKRAARWLKRRRLHREEIPSHQEIQVQMQALSGIQQQELVQATLAQVYYWTRQIMSCLDEFPILVRCAEVQANPTAGAQTVILVQGSPTDIQKRLSRAGYVPQVVPKPTYENLLCTVQGQLRLRGQFPCEIYVTLTELTAPTNEWLTREELQRLLQEHPCDPDATPDNERFDPFALYQLLLQPLARIQWPTDIHPEGDALYHSLQVFELGRAALPYDEEFLLACLLHDVGWAINPRHPVLSAIDALGSLITERTRFLIEQRPVATHYLNTGECPKSLRRSEDFDEVVLLARCDRAGRVPGAQVCSLEEALDYIAGLDHAWDED